VIAVLASFEHHRHRFERFRAIADAPLRLRDSCQHPLPVLICAPLPPSTAKAAAAAARGALVVKLAKEDRECVDGD